jgi:hypothetical protein
MTGDWILFTLYGISAACCVALVVIYVLMLHNHFRRDR